MRSRVWSPGVGGLLRRLGWGPPAGQGAGRRRGATEGSGDDSSRLHPIRRMGVQSRNWCYTFYSESPIADLPKDCHFHVYQREKCPSSGREHWQGILSFNHCVTLRQACRRINIRNIHLEPTRTLVGSVKYCCKKESRVSGPFIFTDERITQEEVFYLKFKEAKEITQSPSPSIPRRTRTNE